MGNTLATINSWSLDNRFDVLDKNHRMKYLGLAPYQRKIVRKMLDRDRSEYSIEYIMEYIDDSYSMEKRLVTRRNACPAI